jgi:hypothetical protein
MAHYYVGLIQAHLFGSTCQKRLRGPLGRELWFQPSVLARFVRHCKKESLPMAAAAAAVPGAEGGCGGGGSVVRIFVGGLAEGVR